MRRPRRVHPPTRSWSTMVLHGQRVAGPDHVGLQAAGPHVAGDPGVELAGRRAEQLDRGAGVGVLEGVDDRPDRRVAHAGVERDRVLSDASSEPPEPEDTAGRWRVPRPWRPAPGWGALKLPKGEGSCHRQATCRDACATRRTSMASWPGSPDIGCAGALIASPAPGVVGRPGDIFRVDDKTAHASLRGRFCRTEGSNQGEMIKSPNLRSSALCRSGRASPGFGVYASTGLDGHQIHGS